MLRIKPVELLICFLCLSINSILASKRVVSFSDFRFYWESKKYSIPINETKTIAINNDYQLIANTKQNAIEIIHTNSQSQQTAPLYAWQLNVTSDWNEISYISSLNKKTPKKEAKSTRNTNNTNNFMVFEENFIGINIEMTLSETNDYCKLVFDTETAVIIEPSDIKYALDICDEIGGNCWISQGTDGQCRYINGSRNQINDITCDSALKKYVICDSFVKRDSNSDEGKSGNTLRRRLAMNSGYYYYNNYNDYSYYDNDNEYAYEKAVKQMEQRYMQSMSNNPMMHMMLPMMMMQNPQMMKMMMPMMMMSHPMMKKNPMMMLPMMMGGGGGGMMGGGNNGAPTPAIMIQKSKGCKRCNRRRKCKKSCSRPPCCSSSTGGGGRQGGMGGGGMMGGGQGGMNPMMMMLMMSMMGKDGGGMMGGGEGGVPGGPGGVNQGGPGGKEGMMGGNGGRPPNAIVVVHSHRKGEPRLALENAVKRDIGQGPAIADKFQTYSQTNHVSNTNHITHQNSNNALNVPGKPAEPVKPAAVPAVPAAPAQPGQPANGNDNGDEPNGKEGGGAKQAEEQYRQRRLGEEGSNVDSLADGDGEEKREMYLMPEKVEFRVCNIIGLEDLKYEICLRSDSSNDLFEILIENIVQIELVETINPFMFGFELNKGWDSDSVYDDEDGHDELVVFDEIDGNFGYFMWKYGELNWHSLLENSDFSEIEFEDLGLFGSMDLFQDYSHVLIEKEFVFDGGDLDDGGCSEYNEICIEKCGMMDGEWMVIVNEFYVFHLNDNSDWNEITKNNENNTIEKCAFIPVSSHKLCVKHDENDGVITASIASQFVNIHK